MVEDFLVETEFRNAGRYSVITDSKTDYLTQSQYSLSFIYGDLRLIAAIDAGELQV